MISTMSYTTILIVVAASILGSDGGTCSCKCCAGNSCTATLQGIIDVQSCDASPCEALCGSKYPQQCVNGPGIGLYECSSGSVSTSTPHWIGTYNIANNCDQRTCCCIVGKLVISSAGANSVRVQCSFAGDACPSAGLSLDETIPTPNGYTTQVAFMGNPIRVTLSEDSRSIQFTNSMFPQCNNNGARDETSSTNPSWVGTYNIANKCDQRTCCCPVGKLVISSAGANSVRVQCSFAGNECPSAGLSLDETIPTPNGYTTQVAFMGNLIRVTLSEDSRNIQLTNPLFPSCSDTATKSGAISGSQINMGLLSLFVGLITIKQFKM